MKFDVNNEAIAVVLALLLFLLGFHVGKYGEKVASIEDVVFNCGLYEKLKQENDDGM